MRLSSGVAANVHGVCHWLVIMGRYKSRDQALRAASKISNESNHQLNFSMIRNAISKARSDSYVSPIRDGWKVSHGVSGLSVAADTNRKPKRRTN